jgi:hypothetical protein
VKRVVLKESLEVDLLQVAFDILVGLILVISWREGDSTGTLVVGCLFFFLGVWHAVEGAGRKDIMTIAEARKRLDELEEQD